MRMTERTKKTRHSISRCPTLIRLQCLQQYQSQWTSSYLVLCQMVQSCIFDFFFKSWEIVAGACSTGWSESLLRSRMVSWCGSQLAHNV